MGDTISLLIALSLGTIFLILVGVIFLSIGIFLGAYLGKVGSLEVLNFILNLPVYLVKSPEKVRSYWKVHQGLRALKKIDYSRKRNQLQGLRNEMNSKKEEFRKLKVQIKKLKWEE